MKIKKGNGNFEKVSINNLEVKLSKLWWVRIALKGR